MKQRVILIGGLLLLSAVTLQAAPIDANKAKEKAQQFISGKQAAARGKSQSSQNLQLASSADGNYYVFNVGQQNGFVIVSGDDRAPEILGYSDSGTFDADNIPTNMRAFLQGYADQISWIRQHGVKSDVAASRALTESVTKENIGPLLTTLWNQGNPYNINCPSFQANGKPAVTGCVATATAQIMFYQAKKHNIESTTTSAEIPSYLSKKYYWFLGNTQYSGMPAKNITTIDWTKIDATLTTEAACTEVARLFEYVGAAVKMQYGPEDEGGSSATNEEAVNALVNYFGYDPDAKSVYRNDYDYEDWVDVIYRELSTNGPVLLGGQSSGGGHAFVADGYSGNGYFHINWGWGGLSDGSFLLSALNPSSQGAGGSSSSDGYNFNQMAMVNVNPVDDKIDMSAEACLTVDRWRINYNTAVWYNHEFNNYYYLKNNTLYPLQMNYSLINATGWDLSFEWGVALYNNDTFVKLISEPHEQIFSNKMNSYGTTSELEFSPNLADGEYRLVAVSRKKGTDTWRPCIGSDNYYISVVVSNSTNNMVLQNMPPIEVYGADGRPMTIEIINDKVTVPNDVLAMNLDFTRMNNTITVTPNDNPNTLYFVSGNNMPSGLDGKNVVKDGVAETLTLIDSRDNSESRKSSTNSGNSEHYGFYTPVDFTVTNATYTRKFTSGADGTRGWSTIVLPFGVTSVTVKDDNDDRPINWFHSIDGLGDFWLKKFVSGDNSSVNFDFVDTWEANTPYIIAVPGNRWGNQYDLTDKDITFYGSNVVISATNNVPTSVDLGDYEFDGTLVNKNVNNSYLMNEEGSNFVLGDGTLQPFRACFKPINQTHATANYLMIGSDDGSATGIVNFRKQKAGDKLFNLQGQRVSQPGRGLYIINGKKIIVK